MRLRHAGSDLPPTYRHSESDFCLRTPRASLVLDLLLDGSIPPHDVSQQGPAAVAATASATAPAPAAAVLFCRTCQDPWEGRHGTAADWAEQGGGKHGSVLYAVTRSLARVRVWPCSALLMPVFISRAAQRLHVDVVCLSEWDVIYPALPCPAVAASKPPLQPAALLSLSLYSPSPSPIIIWSSNRTPDGLVAQPGRPSDHIPGVYVGPAQPPRACFLSLYFVCVLLLHIFRLAGLPDGSP